MEPKNERELFPFATRQLIPDEWIIYRGLRHEMLLTDPSAFPPQAQEDLEADEEKWRRNIENGIVLVAFDNNVPAGIVRGTFEGEKAFARNMYTRLMYRGLGVGKLLMSDLLQKIEEEGKAGVVELEVEDSQSAAIGMYSQFGFEETGRVPQGEKFMITMQKPL